MMTKQLSAMYMPLKVLRLIVVFSFTMIMGKFIGDEKAWNFFGGIVRNRRVKWFKKNRNQLEFEGGLIDQAYTVFYEKFFGFTSQDMEIVERNSDRIVTRWRHFCPWLEACKILGLDPRKICKRSHEKAVNELLRGISPRLRFTYHREKIRPHFEYCEEMIEVIK